MGWLRVVNDNGTEVANDSAECAYDDDDGGGEGLPDCLEVAEEGVAAAAVRDGSVAEIGISRVGPVAQDVIVDDFCAS